MKSFKHNLEGKSFGRLLVLSRTICPKTNRTAWFCKCNCGTIKSILQQSLLSRKSRSCGCGVSKSTSLRFEKKIRKGSRFGKLKVLCKREQDQWGNWLYECLCDCGNKHTTKGTTLRNRRTKSCGCGQIEAVTIHGKSQTKEYRRIKSIENTTKRRAIQNNLNETFSSQEVEDLLVRQNNRCSYCKNLLIAFHRDHKIPLCREGRNIISNIALACPSCNLKKNKKTDREFFNFLNSSEGQDWLLIRDDNQKLIKFCI